MYESKLSTSCLVSVIITTYKRDWHYLCRAIQSVCDQSYSNIEIIVIDDNGDDNDFNWVEKNIFQKFPAVIYSKHLVRKGAQVSRNDGLLLASGEFVAFLDDDDYWIADKISLQMNALNAGADFVFCNGYVEDDNCSRTAYRDLSDFKVSVDFIDLLEKDWIGTTSQAILRKDVLFAVGCFDTQQPARQDYELWLRVAYNGFKIIGLNEYLFIHTIHSGEQISKNPDNAIAGYSRIYNMYRNEYIMHPYCKMRLMLSFSRFYSRKKFCYIKPFTYRIRAAFCAIKALLFERTLLISLLTKK